MKYKLGFISVANVTAAEVRFSELRININTN